MSDPVQDQDQLFTPKEISNLKDLSQLYDRIKDAGNLEGVTTSLNPTHKDSIYFNADQLAAHLGISIKTVYYRSAPKSANPWPFRVLRVGGSKRGRLRFKKSDVGAAIRKGVI